MSRGRRVVSRGRPAVCWGEGAGLTRCPCLCSQLPEEALLGSRLDSHDWAKISNINVSGARSGHQPRSCVTGLPAGTRPLPTGWLQGRLRV